MTIYYVRPTIGSDANGGTSWASDSWATLKKATDTVTAGDHTIIMDNANADVITANPTTYTIAAGVKIMSSNNGAAYATGATVSSVTAGLDINIAGTCYIFGLSFKPGTTLGANLALASSDNSVQYFEDCTFQLTSNSTSNIYTGTNSVRGNCIVRTRNCTWLFGTTGSNIALGSTLESIGDSFAPTGSVPTTLFSDGSYANRLDITGANLSTISGTLCYGFGTMPLQIRISNSLLHASVTPLGSITNLGGTEIFINDCSYMNGATLTGILFYHEDYLGSTTISTAIYNSTSGLTIDGTTKVSWVVDGKTTASYSQPYQSPWIEQYNSGVAPVTPRLEVIRDGSTTAYTDEQVWAEFAFRGTPDSPKLTLNVSDRRGPLSSAANQGTSALTTSDWVGDTTAWFGKLEPSGTITPAEVGYMRARVCVAGDYTVHVDPQILGV